MNRNEIATKRRSTDENTVEKGNGDDA